MKYTKGITINSSIQHLYNIGLISSECRDVLNALKISDAFDIMTTRFPEQNEIINNDIIYTSRLKKEMDKLINDLYTKHT